MPIYAYKCSACGHAQDVLQKMSDPLLEVCPECEQKTYVKQVTAAGFHLKGTGWYVTDFRDGGKAAGAPASATAEASGGSDAAAVSAPAESSKAAVPAPSSDSSGAAAS